MIERKKTLIERKKKHQLKKKTPGRNKHNDWKEKTSLTDWKKEIGKFFPLNSRRSRYSAIRINKGEGILGKPACVLRSERRPRSYVEF